MPKLFPASSSRDELRPSGVEYSPPSDNAESQSAPCCLRFLSAPQPFRRSVANMKFGPGESFVLGARNGGETKELF